MATEALGKVGVEAVVEGMGEFKGNINELNKSIASVGDQGNILTRALSSVGDTFNWLGEQIVNVATYALGKLLADSVEFVISKIGELITNTIQAGAEFQSMSLRLNRLNLNDITASGEHFISVMNMAKEVTKEQLEWIQKLAIQTPYDAQDIANVFTLARSYGFASTASEKLTEDISNFAAGMGLGNTEIQRIIINFGQLKQEGKVTGKELNDLARGAFVPVNDVLQQMQKDTGKTGAAFDEFKKTGEGVNAFFTAFSEIVHSRFTGAAGEMARTLKGASDNAQDFIKSLFGLNVVKPVLDVVGGKIADIVTSLTTDQNWSALQTATQALGASLTDTLGSLFGNVDTSGFVQGMLDSLNQITTWISGHKSDIQRFFLGIGDTIRDKVVPFIQNQLLPGIQNLILWLVNHRGDAVSFFQGIGDQVAKVVSWVQNNLVPAFHKFSDWVNTNKPTIDKFFTALGTIVGKVISNLTGGKLDTSGLSGLLDTVTTFMQYVIDNQDKIAGWVTNLIQLWGILQVVGAVLSFVTGILVTVGTAIISVVAFVAGLIAVFTALANPIGLLIALLGILVYEWVVYGDTVKAFLAETGAAITQWWSDLSSNFSIGVAYTGDLISKWWTSLWANFNIGVAYTKAVISKWWSDLWANFNIGVAYTKAVIAQWWNDLWASFINWTSYIIQVVVQWWNDMQNVFEQKLGELKNEVKNILDSIKNLFSAGTWVSIGEQMINGLISGITNAAANLYATLANVVDEAVNTVVGGFQIYSPSKVFEKLGVMTMQGMAQGIVKGMGLVTGAMDSMTAAVTMPMINLPAITQQYAMAASPMVSTQNSYTNNWNLTIHSQSQTEPIVQDYNMLKSLAGV